MKIVMDACTAILLAKASILEKSLDTYDVSITKPVYKEIIAGKEKMFQDALLVDRLEKEKKMEVIKENHLLTEKLMQDFNMGRGEASTIAAVVKDIKTILATDNRQGRKAAVVNGLCLVGSIELVVSLYKKKKISAEKAIPALIILQKEGWFEQSLIEKAKGDIQ